MQIIPGTLPTCFVAFVEEAIAYRSHRVVNHWWPGSAVLINSASSLYGKINKATTRKTLYCMYGLVPSMFAPLPPSLGLSFRRPLSFNGGEFLKIERVIGSGRGSEGYSSERLNREEHCMPKTMNCMKLVSQISYHLGCCDVFGIIAFWPLLMYGANNIITKGFFIAWIVVGMR